MMYNIIINRERRVCRKSSRLNKMETKLYIEIDEAKNGAIKIEDKYYEVVETYKEAYSILSNKLVAKGSDVSYYEDMYLEQNFNEQYKEAEENGQLEKLFDELFNGVLKEEDYKKLYQWLDVQKLGSLPTEFDPEEELDRLIANKNRKSSFWGDGLKIVAEYLEKLSQEDALMVVTYYYFYFGYNYEDQLISDIQDECVEKAYTV